MTSFLDSDQEIEQAANMSVAEIFARDGEAFSGTGKRRSSVVYLKTKSVFFRRVAAHL